MTIHILANISKGKGNQTMKFGQLIECNMRNIFLEKPYTKYDGETSPRPFSEKLKLSISLGNSLKFYRVCFYCLVLPNVNLFYKIKRGLGLVYLPHFLHNF